MERTTMKNWLPAFVGTGLSVAMLLAAAAPASALTAKECSDKYNAAKAAGTLGGKSWNAFRKAECAAASTTAAPAAPAATGTKPAAAPAPTAAKAAPTAGGAVFPTGIAPAYAKEKPAKARMHTCLDQYKTNKASNGNGGMKWIQKGGGYYSECNKRLKG
jgi:hypothetical protein